MRIWRCTLLSILLISGCASPGPARHAVSKSPPEHGMARVIVERSSDFIYLALSARVKVNGIALGELSRGDEASIDVRPGRTIVSVDTATAPGTFSVSFRAQPNHEYTMEVSPRSGSVLPDALFGYAGAFVDSAINEESGPFQITEKGEKTLTPPRETSAAPGIQSPRPASRQGSAADRLRRLKQLLDQGLIDQRDYEQQKQRILNSM